MRVAGRSLSWVVVDDGAQGCCGSRTCFRKIVSRVVLNEDNFGPERAGCRNGRVHVTVGNGRRVTSGAREAASLLRHARATAIADGLRSAGRPAECGVGQECTRRGSIDYTTVSPPPPIFNPRPPLSGPGTGDGQTIRAPRGVGQYASSSASA